MVNGWAMRQQYRVNARGSTEFNNLQCLHLSVSKREKEEECKCKIGEDALKRKGLIM